MARKRRKIGEILIKWGLITEKQLDDWTTCDFA
jgi:hypothetical protein